MPYPDGRPVIIPEAERIVLGEKFARGGQAVGIDKKLLVVYRGQVQLLQPKIGCPHAKPVFKRFISIRLVVVEGYLPGITGYQPQAQAIITAGKIIVRK